LTAVLYCVVYGRTPDYAVSPGWPPSTLSNFSKCFLAFFMFINVAAEAEMDGKNEIDREGVK